MYADKFKNKIRFIMCISIFLINSQSSLLLETSNFLGNVRDSFWYNYIGILSLHFSSIINLFIPDDIALFYPLPNHASTLAKFKTI